MSRDQNAGRSHSMKIDNISFEMVELIKYLWTTLTIQNFIQEQIKSRLKSGNACYHLVQNLLSSSLLSTSLKIKIYRTKILLVVLYVCETWLLTLREKRRLRVFGNRVLRRIFGPKRDVLRGEWRKLHNEELNYLYCSPNIVRVIKSRMRWAWHAARVEEAYTGFWWGNLRERDHLGEPGVDGRIILRLIFRKWDVGLWTGSSRLRTGTSGWHLWMRLWTFGFHEMRGISWLAENWSASQEGLCSMEWVSK